MSDGEGFELTMELQGGYRFLVDFAQPEGEGPNAAKVLAAAVGNCLSASVVTQSVRNGIEVDVAVEPVAELAPSGDLRATSVSAV